MNEALNNYIEELLSTELIGFIYLWGKTLACVSAEPKSFPSTQPYSMREQLHLTTPSILGAYCRKIQNEGPKCKALPWEAAFGHFTYNLMACYYWFLLSVERLQLYHFVNVIFFLYQCDE